MSDVDNLPDAVPPGEMARLPETPPYTPPAIELRMALETTAAFCDTAMNGKEFPSCGGPINS